MRTSALPLPETLLQSRRPATRRIIFPSWFGTEVPYNEELILASVHTKPIRAQPGGDQTSRKEASDSIFADARSSAKRLAAPKHNRESYAFDALHANSLIAIACVFLDMTISSGRAALIL